MNLDSRGLIITIDASLGAALMLVLVILVFYYVSQTNLDSWNSVDLRSSINDIGAVLEKSRALENSVRQSSVSSIMPVINSSAPAYCSEVTVIDPETSLMRAHAVKTGCVKNAADVFVIHRSFIVNDGQAISFFVAKIEGWVK